MSAAEPEVPAGVAPERVRTTRSFGRRSDVPKLSVDQVRRQNGVLQSAWKHFKSPGPAIAFLNAQNQALEGKPLQLALHSDEGLQRVERLLGQMIYQA